MKTIKIEVKDKDGKPVLSGKVRAKDKTEAKVIAKTLSKPGDKITVS